MKKGPLWMKLIKELSKYICDNDRYVMYVYKGEVPDMGPAAILRIWELSGGAIKATLAITDDTACCSDMDRGLRFIDLEDPRSIDNIFKWLKDIGVVERHLELHGLLKP